MSQKRFYGTRVFFTFENLPHEANVCPILNEPDVYAFEPRDNIFKEVFPDSHDDFQSFPLTKQMGLNERQAVLHSVLAEAIKKAYAL